MTIEPQREIADHALWVLGAFLGDYTDPDDDGHRAKVIVVGGSVEEGFFDVQVVRTGAVSYSSRYRVSLVVRPAPYETGMRLMSSYDESSERGGVSSRDEPGLVRVVPRSGHRT